MIQISNIDKNVRESGLHEYEVSVNKKPLFVFEHSRELSISELFTQAAIKAKRLEILLFKKQTFWSKKGDTDEF